MRPKVASVSSTMRRRSSVFAMSPETSTNFCPVRVATLRQAASVSSASAARASVNRGDYCMSKAGLAMASKLWAVRLAAEGVQVYELRPGVMATDMTAAVKDKYDKMIADGLIPQGRWGTAEDVGRAVSALLKGSLPFSTGEVINIDGGLHLERL